MQFSPSIRTERLHLRAPRLEDAEVMHEAYGQDAAVARYMIWRPHTALAQTQEFVAGCVRAWSEGGRFPFVLTRGQDDRAIGMLDVRDLGHTLDIGYVLQQRDWGNGYMPEAVRRIAGVAFNAPTVFRIQATCDVENVASARTLEKCGFIREARLAYYTVHPNISAEPRPCFMYAAYRSAA